MSKIKLTDLNMLHLNRVVVSARTRLYRSIVGDVEAEMEYVFKAGMKERAGDIKVRFDTLQANIRNDKLSDEDFRELTGQILHSIYEDYLQE